MLNVIFKIGKEQSLTTLRLLGFQADKIMLPFYFVPYSIGKDPISVWSTHHVDSFMQLRAQRTCMPTFLILTKMQAQKI